MKNKVQIEAQPKLWPAEADKPKACALLLMLCLQEAQSNPKETMKKK